jgi:hypothetical protein
VDFKPEAVLLLVDRMRKNPKVAAACGRIHPTGDGKNSLLLCNILSIDLQALSFGTNNLNMLSVIGYKRPRNIN